VYVCLVKGFDGIIAVEYLAVIVDESAYNSLKQAQINTVVVQQEKVDRVVG
jgi:hypothetical protein